MIAEFLQDSVSLFNTLDSSPNIAMFDFIPNLNTKLTASSDFLQSHKRIIFLRVTIWV